ncbi:DUF177 domain-containing protein [Niameybacter massiliensis]|uniref:DUF177 domain-containing protein n=1 Tax=Holtiella tumoricola TaxID=3018743 RepID=A0AA42DQ18_9FIRM|nr:MULTISPECIES: DUF177 domain-containing protein [Lachnospirales]MDA3733125.1 DUF177 domain-containing protein [Holtiella tumoricola]
MIINIQTLTKQDILEFDKEIQISLPNLRLLSKVTDYTARVYGTVEKSGELYTVKGEVDITLKLVCDRCMRTFDYPLHAILDDQFSTSEELLIGDEDIKRVTKSSVDLSDTILESIAMAMPMKSLCKEDCKGMCLECGANLNEVTCKCDKADIDPRLEALKDIFCLNSKE